MSAWTSGTPYEAYVGRWSRPVARELLTWLARPPGQIWLDVACGTGAVSETVVREAKPAVVVGVDLSPDFVAHAREHVDPARTRFGVADAQALPFASHAFDVIVSGLGLNFVPSPERAVAEMARVVRPSGTIGLYVWDYSRGMEMMRRLWDAAAELDPAARKLEEGLRFPLCNPGPLERLFLETGLTDVMVRPIDISTIFRDFDDYWSPFLGGQGPAPGYVASLTDERRAALREHLRAGLPTASDGTIGLVARAWAVRGTARG